MDNFEVRPDDFIPVHLRNPDGSIEGSVPVNAKYDRVDHWPAIGAWAIKAYEDDVGLMSIYCDEKEARRVVEAADLPLVEREFMYRSEHEAFVTAQASLLTDEMFGLDEVGEPEDGEES